MKLIICRHGETKANAKGEIQGHRPGELSERGLEQARLLSQRLSSERFSAIYCSDLKRARDTVQEVASHHRSPLHFTEELRERAWGDLEGHSFTELFGHDRRPRGPEWINFVPPNGESLSDLRVRAARFIDVALKPHGGNETLLITAHHSINKMLMMVLLGWPTEDWEKLEQGNTCVNVLEGEIGGAMKAQLLNCTAHLGDAGRPKR